MNEESMTEEELNLLHGQKAYDKLKGMLEGDGPKGEDEIALLACGLMASCATGMMEDADNGVSPGDSPHKDVYMSTTELLVAGIKATFPETMEGEE